MKRDAAGMPDRNAFVTPSPESWSLTPDPDTPAPELLTPDPDSATPLPNIYTPDPDTPSVHLFTPDPSALSPENATIPDDTYRRGLLAKLNDSSARSKAPLGDFDSGVRTLEQQPARLTSSQVTAERTPDASLLAAATGKSAASAGNHAAAPERAGSTSSELDDDDIEEIDDDELEDAGHGVDASAARLPPPPTADVRGDATTIDPQTAKFERGDPTADAPPDRTVLAAPSVGKHPTGGTLRRSAQLRRKRGVYGDARYVFTALFGVRRAKRELEELDHRQGLRQTSRRRHLVTLGRSAVVMDTFDHPALGKARERLQAIEDERSKHAGAVAASDAELERVSRDRLTKAAEYSEAIAKIDTELAELAKKLEPLEKDAAKARKRAQELRDSLHRIDKQLADTEALLVSVKGEKMDKAGIHADIATYKADRQAVLRDEPVIAAELDALNPRIAAIEATRAEHKKKRGELEKSETEDQRRTAELLEAIGAKRKVVERASADAEAARDSALFELGEQLYVDRPKLLAAQLAPIDQIDLELGEGERRTMELREILSNIDKAKFARGLALILLVLAAIGTFAYWLLTMLL